MTIDPVKSIPAFYAGQSILLTGATGFLGKTFIEKVLRSCPDVREIFLLMRSKKGLDLNERLEKMLKLPLYEKLCNERPSAFEKLIPISGDIREKGLGLSAADRQMLVERVTIIIHAAASVRFNDSLKYAIFSNTRATRDICILAQSMKNLIDLVYVSSAYLNTNNPIIEEKVYPPVTDWRKMIEMAELLDEHTLNIFTTKCLDYIPNTYVFSKTLAEDIIQEYSLFFPCAIVRPSMVYPTLKEPFLGWIDNMYGPIGLQIVTGKGLIHVYYCDKNGNGDVVPADIVIKAILVVAWKLGLTTYDNQHNFTEGFTCFVLNCTSQKSMTFGEQSNVLQNIGREIPFEGIIWTYDPILTNNFIVFHILTILLHILPAVLIDLILKFSGRRPMLVQLQRRLYVVSCFIGYFLYNKWEFCNINSSILISSISSDDRDTFSFEYSDFDLYEYYKNCAIGVKKFLLHEDMNRLDAAKAHAKRIDLFVGIVKSIISISMLWIIYKWICC